MEILDKEFSSDGFLNRNYYVSNAGMRKPAHKIGI